MGLSSCVQAARFTKVFSSLSEAISRISQTCWVSHYQRMSTSATQSWEQGLSEGSWRALSLIRAGCCGRVEQNSVVMETNRIYFYCWGAGKWMNLGVHFGSQAMSTSPRWSHCLSHSFPRWFCLPCDGIDINKSSITLWAAPRRATADAVGLISMLHVSGTWFFFCFLHYGPIKWISFNSLGSSFVIFIWPCVTHTTVQTVGVTGR